MLYFTPGPGQLYPSVPLHIRGALERGIASISHRSEAYMDIQRSTVHSLRELLNIPEEYHIFFGGSATEMMERILQNSAKTHTLHLVNGAFSNKFYHLAKMLKKKAVAVQIEDGLGFSRFPCDQLKPETELICLTLCETSTGILTNPHLIQCIRRNHPNKLIAVDMVSSCPMIPLDISAVDCAFFSVQKGFGMPSGLGVIIVSNRCLERARHLAEHSGYMGGFHSFDTWNEFGQKYQTPETPNVLAIYLLGHVCKDFMAVGIENIRKKIDIKSGMINRAVRSHPLLSFSIAEPEFRSPSVIVLNTKGGAGRLLEAFENRGIVLGMGYGKRRDSQIRIANFPAHTIDDVNKLCRLLIKNIAS